MNWNEIAGRYKSTGINLIEKINEGTRSLKDGLGKNANDLKDTGRTHKILLRVGFEFLIKSLYLRKRWNIYNFNINPLLRFTQISQINESDLNLNKTIDLT